MDRLTTIFEIQKELQEKLGVTFNQDYINTMTLACEQELHEALRETPWKPWKKQQEFNRENYKKELVDALHFFVNLCLAGGITADEIFEEYLNKNKENHVRKETGY